MYVRYWMPQKEDMTRMAKTICYVIYWGQYRLSWDPNKGYNNNSTIIDLVNKFLHDRRIKRDFFEWDYWFFAGTWLNGLYILNGWLSPREFEIVWSDRTRLPLFLLEAEESIKLDYLQYASKGFYYHSHYTLPYL